MRLMASASNGATESCLIFPHFRACGLSGIVSVTTTSCNRLPSIRATAGPERTGWVAQAETCFAPWDSSVSTACVRVPAVSIKSSRIMAFLPLHVPDQMEGLGLVGGASPLIYDGYGGIQASLQRPGPAPLPRRRGSR
jgi:hypothetical protein